MVTYAAVITLVLVIIKVKIGYGYLCCSDYIITKTNVIIAAYVTIADCGHNYYQN
jgi:hypothetical protein